MAIDQATPDARSGGSLPVATPVPPTGSLLGFFSITYLLTWTWFSLVAIAPIPARASLLSLLVLPGVFAPALVALLVTARAEGGTGVRALLGRVLQWHVPVRWYLFAAGYMAAVKLVVALSYRVVTVQWPRFGDTPWYVIAVAIVISTPFQVGEELGWRGYALPRLAARFGLAPASVVLGVIWACWHLPLFFIPEADTYTRSFFVYLLQVTALSVAIAWLYAHTSGSLLLAMLMHAAINNSKDIVPSASASAPTNTFGLSASLVGWLTVAALWFCAAVFLIWMGKWPSVSPEDSLEPLTCKGP
jgi:membrane protease YdiL (CAAX protease family)